MVGAGVLLLIVLAAAAAWWWRQAHQPPPAGYLKIVSAHPGAQLLIDGKAEGMVAADGTVALNVQPGEHNVQLTMEGYEPFVTGITVSAGERENLIAAMKPLPPPPPAPVELGTLSVQSNVAQADILVDGQLQGLFDGLGSGVGKRIHGALRTDSMAARMLA